MIISKFMAISFHLKYCNINQLHHIMEVKDNYCQKKPDNEQVTPVYIITASFQD